jgi:hypothetical protein
MYLLNIAYKSFYLVIEYKSNLVYNNPTFDTIENYIEMESIRFWIKPLLASHNPLPHLYVISNLFVRIISDPCESVIVMLKI